MNVLVLRDMRCVKYFLRLRDPLCFVTTCISENSSGISILFVAFRYL